jgi:hypothetical protein
MLAWEVPADIGKQVEEKLEGLVQRESSKSAKDSAALALKYVVRASQDARDVSPRALTKP